MSKHAMPGLETTHKVRDTCLCLHAQRAARALARIYDEAFKPLGLKSGQFSLLMSLNRSQPPRIGDVAAVLAMDRTTLTANLKPLERRGLVEVTVDEDDRRSRRLALTPRGRSLLAEAYPVWERTHATVECLVADHDPDSLRQALAALSFGEAAASDQPS